MSVALTVDDEDDCLQSNFSRRGFIATANIAREGLDKYDAACAIALSGRPVMHNIPSSS